MPYRAYAVTVTTALLCAVALFGALSSHAAQAGKALRDVDFVEAAVQPDGKVIAAGTTSSGTFVARFGANGRLDRSFGDGGIARPELSDAEMTPDAIAIGGSGEITVSFRPQPAGESGGSVLLRLSAEGRPDTGFGTNGLATVAASRIPSIVPVGGGAVLIIAGVRSEGDPKDKVLRVRADGSVDPSFAIESQSTEYGVGEEIVQGPEGNIYLALQKPAPAPNTAKYLVVLRFLPSGEPDPSFDEDGVAEFHNGVDVRPPGAQGAVLGTAVGPGGDVVLSYMTAPAYKSGSSPELFRVSGDGSALTKLAPPGCAGRVAVAPDGTITVAGLDPFVPYSNPNTTFACIERINPAGVPDRGLESAGAIGLDRVLTLQPDGRVVATGRVYSSGGRLAERFLASATVDGIDRRFGLSFLPALGCRGHNPTVVSQSIWTEQDAEASVPSGPMRAIGTDRRDVILGTEYNELIVGSQGRDLICAGPGIDRVHGGPGRDRIFGGAGADRLFGGQGRDKLFGGPGRDRVRPRGRT